MPHIRGLCLKSKSCLRAASSQKALPPVVR